MVQTVRRTIVVPQLLYNGYRRPCCAVVQVLPRRCPEAVSMVQTVCLTMDIPSCRTRWPKLVMQVHFLVVAQRPFSHGQTIEILQLQYAPVVNVPVELSGCAGRAVYLCTRPGLTPAIRAGMAGTPGACSQAFCHPIRCTSWAYTDRHKSQTHCHNHHHHHTTTTTTPPPPQPPHYGRNRVWPNLIWPSLCDRLWPNRLWPNRFWPKLRF